MTDFKTPIFSILLPKTFYVTAIITDLHGGILHLNGIEKTKKKIYG